MQIINLTPHPLDVQRTDGIWVNIPPSGQVARVAERRVPGPVVYADFGEFATEFFAFGDVVDMPAPADGVVYVVSKLVAQALGNRLDVVCPGETLRGAKGHAIRCVGFSRWLPRKEDRNESVHVSILDDDLADDLTPVLAHVEKLASEILASRSWLVETED